MKSITCDKCGKVVPANDAATYEFMGADVAKILANIADANFGKGATEP